MDPRIPRTEDALREWANQRLSWPLNDAEWDLLTEDGLVQETLGDDFMTPEDFLARVRRSRRAFAPPRAVMTPVAPAPRAALTDDGRPSDYERAAASLLARRAGQLEQVQRFRSAHLSGRQLNATEARAWLIDRVHEATDEFFVGIETVEVGTYEDSWNNDELRVYESEDANVRDNQPRSRRVLALPVAGAVLEDLRDVAIELQRCLGWTQADAVQFVITSETPQMPAVRTSYVRPAVGSPTVTARIVMSLDVTVDPNVAASAFRRMRSRVTPLHRRHRRAPRSYVLAEFFARRPEDEPWRESMERWNAEHPDRRYGDVPNFWRDCHEAERRVLSPPLTDEI